MGGGAQEVVAVRREVDDEEATAGRDEPGRFGDGPGRVVEVVQHLMDHDEIEAGRVERRAVHVALAELPVGDTGAFEVGAGNRQHRVAGVESDGAVGAIGEQLQHAAGAGADVEHPTERLVADGGEDRCFDGVGGGVQRALLVPDRCDLLEVLAAPTSPGVSARCRAAARSAARTGSSASIDVDRGPGDERVVSRRVDEAEERPGALAVLGDEAGIDEQAEVPRHARLRLAEDLGEVGDGQFTVTQQCDDAQPGLLADGLQRVERWSEVRLHVRHSRGLYKDICMFANCWDLGPAESGRGHRPRATGRVRSRRTRASRPPSGSPSSRSGRRSPRPAPLPLRATRHRAPPTTNATDTPTATRREPYRSIIRPFASSARAITAPDAANQNANCEPWS